ncbi:hypothetical protein [Gimesia sp.]|uniref:hypothetical protein n=1 Tax=Gimesia sp. TaxID=2024833 RepID=UPI003A9094DB
MVESTIRAWLDLWHELLDDPAIPPFQDPEEMAGVLADFRRDPERLAKAFTPLPLGDELLDRVRLCIETERNHAGIYLVPDAVEATEEELRVLVAEAIERGCQCCGIEVPDYPIHIQRRAMTSEESLASAPLVEELGDLYISLACNARGPESKAMQFLRETLYTLAASFEVQGYCLTPLCPPEIRAIDPYQPQFELWRRRAQAVVRWREGSPDLWVDVFVDA